MYYTRTKKKKYKSTSQGNSTSQFSGNGRKKNNRPPSTLDPELLIKKSKTPDQKVPVAEITFEQMPLNKRLKQNIAGKGYIHPTPIQEQTFEDLVKGRDLLGIANTGTGKTGAFLIPIIERLIQGGDFTTLVILPTRELALQVEEEFKSLTKGLGLYAAGFIGGTSVGRDIANLKRKNHIFIGTPGRLMDLADRGALKLSGISVLVLDEFDRMLDMGFVNDIKKIVSGMTRRKQTMLFSATIDRSQQQLIDNLLNNPKEVKVSTGTSTAEQIEQDIIRVPSGADKFKMLLDLLNNADFERVLVFAETKRLADRVSKKLNKSGVSADMIHGNKSQNYRNNALDKFKKGRVQVLVATDVAARGIDVTDISHVINYQLPQNFDSYIHRIGRTGRAGKTGKAFTFVD